MTGAVSAGAASCACGSASNGSDCLAAERHGAGQSDIKRVHGSTAKATLLCIQSRKAEGRPQMTICRRLIVTVVRCSDASGYVK